LAKLTWALANEGNSDMTRVTTIIASAVAGLALGIGVAFAAAADSDIVSAQRSVSDAIMHLQNAGQDRSPNAEDINAHRVRAAAFLTLAQTELQAADAKPLYHIN
jgi:hypothetical protein